ncbi:MAG: hydroxymethylbilane synthase [Acidobacteria bacterium]|nr:hydroxymethylbilane synthase [Acidobacteriota bacterium]
MSLRLGTRGSQLALWQARTVAAAVEQAGGPTCTIVVIKTSGDRLQNAPLSEVGGKRLFVKEIEDALLSKEIDVAVHSSKDMPAVLPERLHIGAVLPREDPADVIVLPHDESTGTPFTSIGAVLERVGLQPRIGTSSVRRIAQLKHLLPEASFAPIRGNLDTRLRKLDQGDYDLLVLAGAGLRRLGFGSRISLALPVKDYVPAPGQGTIAIEVREDDARTGEVVNVIDHPATAASLRAERALVAGLGGGCQMPVGALAVPQGDELHLDAVVSSLDGQRLVRGTRRGLMTDADTVGRQLARDLLSRGADALLDEARRATGKVEGLQP